MARIGNWNMAKNGMTAHSIDHNMRTENDKAHNVVRTFTPDNENWANARLDILTKQSRTELIQLAAAAAKDKTGRSMQKKQAQAFFREAVLNLEAHHTANDVLAVVNEINHKLDNKKNSRGDHITPLRIDVHRDEGHFVDKNGIDFYPGINIFEGRGQDKGKFFLDEKRTHQVKDGELEFKCNYHAHIIYTHFDFNTGRSAQLTKSDIQNQHRTAAEVLGLEMPKTGKERADAGDPTAGLNNKQLRAYYAALRIEKIKAMGLEPTTYEPHQKFKQQGENEMTTTTLKPTNTELTDEQKRQEWEQLSDEKKRLNEELWRDIKEAEEEERMQLMKEMEAQLPNAKNEQAKNQKRQIHECTYQGKVIGRIIDDGDELKSLGFQSEKAAAYNLLKMAKDKDWNNITLKGSDEFVAAAIEYANKQDIQLKLTDEQERIRQELEQTPLQEQDEKEQQYIDKLHYQEGIEQERTQEREQLLQDKEEYTRKEQECAESNESFNMEKHLEGRAEEKRINENLEITPLEEAYNELMKEWVIDDEKEKIDLEDLRIVRENLEQEKRVLLDKQQLERYYHDEAYRHKDKNNGNLNDDNQTNTDTQEKNKNALNRKFKP